MDYKILILLILLLFIVVLLYKEIYNLKDGIFNGVKHVLSSHTENNKQIANKFKADADKCINQLKSISSENIYQLQRITQLNNQPIRKIANHFTETDDSEFNTQMEYLSPMFPGDIINQPAEKYSQYYMSEDTRSKEEDIPVYQTTDQECVEPEEEIKPEDQEPINQELEDIYVKSEELDEINIDMSGSIKKILNKDSQKNSASESHVDSIVENPNAELSNKTESEESSSDTGSDSTGSSTEETGSESESESESEKNSSNNKDSLFSKTSIISNRSKMSMLSVVTGPTEETDLSPVIKGLVDTGKLGVISNYTAAEIKDISKYFSIPQTLKTDKGTRRSYKKDELYKKIKTELRKTSLRK